MADQTHVKLMRRIARAQDATPDASPLSTSRAVRLALAKAAHDSIGLSLSVSSVSEDIGSLDDLLAGLPEGLMLVRIEQGNALVGVLALDMQLRAAVLEVQTAGALVNQAAEPRAPTGTDRFMCDPLLLAFLRAFPPAVEGTEFAGWADDVAAGTLFRDARVAGLELADGTYRSVQMTVDLGATDRQGMLLMALPLPPPVAIDTQPQPPAAEQDWSGTFRASVGVASACLTARLHRFSATLATVQGFEVGTVVPMPGCTVGSVRLIAQDGRDVAKAKLGQSGGMRAVRLEVPPVPAMEDLKRPVPQIQTPSVAYGGSVAPDPPLPETRVEAL